MNEDLLNQEVQRYILDHLNTDVLSLLFKESPFPNISTKELAEQIEAKAKSKKNSRPGSLLLISTTPTN
ncbi:hypothetical protein [Maribacter aestuarii]|uniref:hypothetical protein n=1 Tax=Maribacter aestuarii TaxID=1130723 RepID=UPI0032220FC9